MPEEAVNLIVFLILWQVHLTKDETAPLLWAPLLCKVHIASASLKESC